MANSVLCFHSDRQILVRLANAVEKFGDGLLVAERYDVRDTLATRATNGKTRPMMVLAGGEQAAELLRHFHDVPELSIIRRILVGDPSPVDENHHHARVPIDFNSGEMATVLRSELTNFALTHAPEQIGELAPLLDAGILAGAWIEERGRRVLAEDRMRDLQGAVLGLDDRSEADAEHALIEEADRLFSNPARDSYADGDILFYEGNEADGVRAVVGGKIELFRRIDGEDVSFYTETHGRLVGLMSLSRGGPAFFSCRAVGEVRVLHLTRKQLREAVMTSPRFAGLLVTVILLSLGRRNRHASRLLLKVHVLNRAIAARRDQLEIALADLEAAQVKLVEAGKMATLGNLAAGVAHELNNPSAALLRASECLRENMHALLACQDGSRVALESMDLGYERKPLSTRDERTLKHEMMAKLGGDRALASALVSSGITNEETLDHLLSLAQNEKREQTLGIIEQGCRMGSALRTIKQCSARIARLTGSLKMYARGDEEQVEHVDINGTLEDVLLIVGHRLRGIEVLKEYGTPPLVCCIPAQIEQVWTNLIVNATQAMGNHGILRIRTMEDPAGHARIEVEDNGPGIPHDIQPRVFENRFTTKGGRVEFGLGLGLPICQAIVTRHGGRIGCSSTPGHTVFYVELPVTTPTPSQP